MGRRKDQLATAILGAALLASCGGGGDAPSATPQRAVSELRARALAVVALAVSPQEAARQLMDFGEANFPQFFPRHEATQTLGPFVYRHYAATGAYLGVVVVDGQGYQYLGVYVMGGPFGAEPALVGPLTDFINPVPTTGGGASNGCYDLLLANADRAGTRIVTVMRTETTPPLFSTTDELVVGPTTFEGHAVTDNRIRVRQGSFPDGIPGDDASASHLYTKLTGPAEVTHYGELEDSNTVSEIPGGGTLTTTTQRKLVYDPPWIPVEGTLALGATATGESRGRTTVTTRSVYAGGPIAIPPVVAGPIDSTFDERVPVRFVRREPVTVPAGTFNACVFEYTHPQVRGEVWVADGKGFPLKMVAGSEVTVTTSIRFNGQAVTN